MTTYHEPEARRGWSRTRWIVLAGLVLDHRGRHSRAQAKFNSLLLKNLFCLSRDFHIHTREDSIEEFNDGNFRAQSPPNRA